MIRVVVVDDHDLVRTGIVKLLEGASNIRVAGDARNGEDAVALCRKIEPDVVLMDVRMPGIGGLEATRKIARLCPDTRIVALTVATDHPFPERLLEAGAAGFLTKDADVDQMLHAINAVASGQRYLSPDVAQSMALKPFQGDTGSGNPFDELSDRELQISLMVVNGEKVQAIADQLHLSPKTVNSYRYRIFDKLRIGSDVELTRLAIRYGLVDAD